MRLAFTTVDLHSFLNIALSKRDLFHETTQTFTCADRRNRLRTNRGCALSTSTLPRASSPTKALFFLPGLIGLIIDAQGEEWVYVLNEKKGVYVATGKRAEDGKKNEELNFQGGCIDVGWVKEKEAVISAARHEGLPDTAAPSTVLHRRLHFRFRWRGVSATQTWPGKTEENNLFLLP